MVGSALGALSSCGFLYLRLLLPIQGHPGARTASIHLICSDESPSSGQKQGSRPPGPGYNPPSVPTAAFD
ncbi:hypothetical protein PABY_03000 [Pyrodictium abyssi]|uniref:Uncharacterized protein n=1 Tax=Pyrodictium abyssi TaxID=54256 RepID=A0ABM8IT49_9CREN|nr:hypothetical protein PABY_03000 [Pyrodictium abyssi]